MLSKASEYAIRSLVYIAIKNRDGIRPGFREIAREIEAPEQFTAKILQICVRKKLLQSARGRGGGFFFEPNNHHLPLLNIIDAIEGLKLFTRCGIGLSRCSSTNPCPIHNQYTIIRNQYQQLTANTTIGMLADKTVSGEAVLNRMDI